MLPCNIVRVWVCSVILVLSGAATFVETGAQPMAQPADDPRVAAWQAEYHRPVDAPFPDDNPYSAAKAELGRMLFFDPLLSRSGARSCSSCHNPALSWGDGLPRSVGDGTAPVTRRTPTMLNAAWTPLLGCDGRFKDLEAVTFAPITNVTMLNMTEPETLQKLSANPGYQREFAKVFDDGPITRRHVEMAIATYARTIVSSQAPFDRWIDGDEAAIDDAAKRGFSLFNGRAHCAACHSGWAFTDGSFHDVGTAEGDDIGRGRLLPNSVKQRYAFKVPTLRDVARRAPYIHDGSLPTLEAVIDLYDKGGIARPSRSLSIQPLGLTGAEKSDIIAFLQTLTGADQATPIPTLPR